MSAAPASDSGTGRRYGGQRVVDRRADRRAQFREAGLSVFTEKTFAAATVSDVCAAAGLSRRQFYEEYRGREALLLQIYDEIQQQARDAATAGLNQALAEGITDATGLVGATLTGYAESVGGDPRRTQLAFIEIVGVSPEVERHRIATRTAWVEFIEEFVRGALGPQITPPGGWHLAGMAFISAVNGLVNEWTTLDPRPPLGDVIDVLTTLLVALIGAEAD